MGAVVSEEFILGAQWTSFDNGMTWERVPKSWPDATPPADKTHMTVVGVNKARGEVTVKMDLGAVFGVFPPVIHVYSPELPNGSLRGRAICGAIVLHPDVSNTARESDAARATCRGCKERVS